MAQDNSSSSRVAQRHPKVGHPCEDSDIAIINLLFVWYNFLVPTPFCSLELLSTYQVRCCLIQESSNKDKTIFKIYSDEFFINSSFISFFPTKKEVYIIPYLSTNGLF